MNSSFEYITLLEYKVKALQTKVDSFESGERFQNMKKRHLKMVKHYEYELRSKEREIEALHRQIIHNRDKWFEVYEDVQKECAKTCEALQKEISMLKERILEVERQRDQALDKQKKYRNDWYSTASELADLKGKNQKLLAQLNLNFENSSIPSSKGMFKKRKIQNSREKTGRKPGAQPGHKGHRRQKHEVTEYKHLTPSTEILNDPDFKKTAKTITKQLVNISVSLEVTEYSADVYRNSKTGEIYHAPFPEGVVNDVNYGGSVKAFLFLLNNECCTSIDKSRRFLSDITGGRLNISKGMINSLSREFRSKTESEYKKIFADMLCAPVMHTDCTNARVNGKSAYVFVCALPEGPALYFAREKKGHAGVKGTVTEDYQGILVHDHESTFYSYGTDHQECLAHILRALKGSEENEKDRTWNSKMRELIRDMIHYRKHLPEDEEVNDNQVREYEEKYFQILDLAREEYENIPPGDYYREGYNLYRRLHEYSHNHLLFLHDRRVPTTNNLSERLLRQFKRKQTQAVSFRSFESIENLCRSMSMLLFVRQNEEDGSNLYQRVAEIFR